jgi:uncharacterized membrane protein YbaN (DUF454 family)
MMDTTLAAALGVIGALLGVIVTSTFQMLQSARSRRWQNEDAISTAKRAVYAEYVRAISASHAQAVSRDRKRTEDGNLYAAAAVIQILSPKDVSEAAQALVETVVSVHNTIAEHGETATVVAQVAQVDQRRRAVLNLFKADLGLDPQIT